MNGFDYKDVYTEYGRRVLEINILPEKYCNFDCIFCPIGRSKHKVDIPQSFGELDRPLKELGSRIDETAPDLVFINSKGEALIHDKLGDIIDFIKARGCAVRLLSNGYLLGRKEYREIANRCDEVFGELKVITDQDFQKVQRPMEGYTLEQYINNMIAFRTQYSGTFLFEITIIKGYNDDESALERLKEIVRALSPDRLIVLRMEEEKFQEKLGISPQRLKEISDALQSALS